MSKSKILPKSDASKILSDVSVENASYFCTKKEVYTKVLALSLKDFADKLDGIDVASVMFHYPRGDFQAWIKDSLKDHELADRMCFIQQGISGEKLRYQLLTMVKTRINELKEKFPSSQCNPEGLCLS